MVALGSGLLSVWQRENVDFFFGLLFRHSDPVAVLPLGAF